MTNPDPAELPSQIWAELSALGLSPEEVLAALRQQSTMDFAARVRTATAVADPVVDPVPDTPRGFRIRLDLHGARPPVWRRLEVPGDITLPRLHVVIQTAMGWTNSHLHKFRTETGYRAPAFLTDFDLAEGEQGIAEQDVRLDQVVQTDGDVLWYEYDFGDGWEHSLKVEAVLDAVPDTVRCTKAKLACPPEDCGGLPGYEELADWVRGGYRDDDTPPSFATAADARTWLPHGWHPDVVDIDTINRDLQSVTAEPIAVTGELGDIAARLDHGGFSVLTPYLTSSAFHDSRAVTAAEATSMTEPFRILLDIVGEGVPLTAAGYLKPAIVTELARRTEVDTWWIGTHNREDLTPPIAELRDIARMLGLVLVRNRRMTVTAVGKKLATDPVALLRHIASRLPLGTARHDREAGWLTLLVIGAELPDENPMSTISHLLFEAGWRRSDNPRVAPYAANPTVSALGILSGQLRGGKRSQDWTTAAETARLAIATAREP